MNGWINVIAGFVFCNKTRKWVRENWKVSQSWTLPLANGCRILIWLQNNEVTLAAGRWRYERTVQGQLSLQVFQYLIAMATLRLGELLNDNWNPWPLQLFKTKILRLKCVRIEILRPVLLSYSILIFSQEEWVRLWWHLSLAAVILGWIIPCMTDLKSQRERERGRWCVLWQRVRCRRKHRCLINEVIIWHWSPWH